MHRPPEFAAKQTRLRPTNPMGRVAAGSDPHAGRPDDRVAQTSGAAPGAKLCRLRLASTARARSLATTCSGLPRAHDSPCGQRLFRKVSRTQRIVRTAAPHVTCIGWRPGSQQPASPAGCGHSANAPICEKLRLSVLIHTNQKSSDRDRTQPQFHYRQARRG